MTTATTAQGNASDEEEPPAKIFLYSITTGEKAAGEGGGWFMKGVVHLTRDRSVPLSGCSCSRCDLTWQRAPFHYWTRRVHSLLSGCSFRKHVIALFCFNISHGSKQEMSVSMLYLR